MSQICDNGPLRVNIPVAKSADTFVVAPIIGSVIQLANCALAVPADYTVLL